MEYKKECNFYREFMEKVNFKFKRIIVFSRLVGL